MKYFTKIALFGFKKKEPKPKPVKPFKTYNQTITSLPTFALKRRLINLQSSANVYESGTMPDNIKTELGNKMMPIINELKNRGEKWQ